MAWGGQPGTAPRSIPSVRRGDEIRHAIPDALVVVSLAADGARSTRRSGNMSDRSSRGAPPPEPASIDSTTPVEEPSNVGTWRAVRGGVQAKVERARQQLEERRATSRSVDVLFVSIQRDSTTGGAVLAAALAFRIFLFVVPYAFVVVYGFGFGTSAVGSDPQDLARQAGIVGLLASTITVAAEQSTTTRIVVLGAALYALFSSSRSFLKVLAIVHTLAWQLPPQPARKLTKPVALFLAVVTGSFVLFQCILWLRDRSFSAGLLAEILFIGIPMSLLLVLSLRFFPRAEGAGVMDLLPGAVLVGVGVQALHFTTVYWVTHLLESKSDRYGAIGVALTILFWAYLLGRIFSASAVLNASAWQQRA